MRKIWIILIGALIVGAVAVTGAWKRIPYLSDLIWDSGITVPLNDFSVNLMNTIRSNPQALLGILGAAATAIIGLLKTFNTRITEFKQARQLASETLGGITENYATLKTQYEELTGEKDTLIQEVTDLQDKLTLQAEQYGNIQNVIDAKDEQIKKLQTQQDELHDVIKRAKLSEDEVIVKTKVL